MPYKRGATSPGCAINNCFPIVGNPSGFGTGSLCTRRKQRPPTTLVTISGLGDARTVVYRLIAVTQPLERPLASLRPTHACLGQLIKGVER